MSDKKPTKKPTRKPKATTTAAAEPPRDNTRERTDLLAKLLQEQGIQRAVLRITNAWSDTLLEDEAGRLEYIRSAYEELFAEFIPRIAVDALEARYGIEAVKKTLGDHAKGAVERWKKAIPELFDKTGDRHQEARMIDGEAAQNRLAVRSQAGARRERSASEATQRSIVTMTLLIANKAAFLLVELALQRGGTLLEVSRRLLLIASDHAGTLAIATSGVSMAMFQAVLSPIEQPRNHDITERRGGMELNLSLRTGVEVYHRDREEILDQMFQRFHEINHDNGAGLAKLHAYLMSRAWETGGDLPFFRIELSDVLETMGYAKNDDRRGYHADTMRQMRELLALLRSYTVRFRVPKKKGGAEDGFIPFWHVEVFHRDSPNQDQIAQTHGQDVTTADIVPVVLRDNAPQYNAVTLRPGLWWAEARMSDYHIEIHPGVLKLSTTIETERIAGLASLYLAFHVRRNHNKHAGEAISLKVGTLLEGASITTRDEFFASSPNFAKRLRTYLDDLEDGGALPLLRQMGAFDVSIADESEYMFTGRGWKERFWEARLLVAIPSLGIERVKRDAKQAPKSKQKKTPRGS